MSGAGVSGGPALLEDGSGNLITSTAGALDVNLKSASGGAIPISGTVAVSSINTALPAGANTIGKIDFAPIAAQLISGVISFSSSGDNAVIAAGSGAQVVRVYRLVATAAAATVLTFKSGAGTALSGAMTLNAGGSITLDFDGEPWYTTAAATAFVMNSTNAVQISGTVYSVTS